MLGSQRLVSASKNIPKLCHLKGIRDQALTTARGKSEGMTCFGVFIRTAFILLSFFARLPDRSRMFSTASFSPCQFNSKFQAFVDHILINEVDTDQGLWAPTQGLELDLVTHKLC